MTDSMWIGGDVKEFTLPNGYILVPLTRKEHRISEDGEKYALYYFSVLVGILFADRDVEPDRYRYTITAWDYKHKGSGYDIQELLTSYCTQHKMGLIK